MGAGHSSLWCEYVQLQSEQNHLSASQSNGPAHIVWDELFDTFNKNRNPHFVHYPLLLSGLRLINKSEFTLALSSLKIHVCLTSTLCPLLRPPPREWLAGGEHQSRVHCQGSPTLTSQTTPSVVQITFKKTVLDFKGAQGKS